MVLGIPEVGGDDEGGGDGHGEDGEEEDEEAEEAEEAEEDEEEELPRPDPRRPRDQAQEPPRL